MIEVGWCRNRKAHILILKSRSVWIRFMDKEYELKTRKPHNPRGLWGFQTNGSDEKI